MAECDSTRTAYNIYSIDIDAHLVDVEYNSHIQTHKTSPTLPWRYRTRDWLIDWTSFPIPWPGWGFSCQGEPEPDLGGWIIEFIITSHPDWQVFLVCPGSNIYHGYYVGGWLPWDDPWQGQLTCDYNDISPHRQPKQGVESVWRTSHIIPWQGCWSWWYAIFPLTLPWDQPEIGKGELTHHIQSLPSIFKFITRRWAQLMRPYTPPRKWSDSCDLPEILFKTLLLPKTHLVEVAILCHE